MWDIITCPKHILFLNLVWLNSDVTITIAKMSVHLFPLHTHNRRSAPLYGSKTGMLTTNEPVHCTYGGLCSCSAVQVSMETNKCAHINKIKLHKLNVLRAQKGLSLNPPSHRADLACDLTCQVACQIGSYCR